MSTPSISDSARHPGVLGLGQLEITPLRLIYLEGLLALFLAAGSLTWPLGNDQSFFYFVAHSILRGGVPYRDAWELKGPLTYYVCAAVLAVFGHREISIRIFDLMVVGLFCWWLKRTVLRLGWSAGQGAMFAMVYFGLWYVSQGFWNTAQPEEWGAFLIAMAVVLSIESSWLPMRTMVISGVLIALATLLKPTFIIFLPLPVLFSVSQRKWARACLCLLTFVSTVILTLAIAFRNGGLEDYWDVLRFLGTSYSPLSKRDLLAEIGALPLMLWRMGLAVPYLFVLPTLVLIWRNRGLRFAGILATWFCFAVLLVVAQGMYWDYSFILANIAVAVILGTGLSLLCRRGMAPIVGHLATGMAALLIGLSVVLSESSDYFYGSLGWPNYMLGIASKSDYMLKVTGGYHVEELDEVAAYVKNRTTENDTILLWGYDIRVLAMAQRMPPTRFGTFEALVTEGPMQVKYRQIFLDDIFHRPPAYVVVDSLGSGYRSESSLWLLRNFGEFNRFLHSRYREVTQIGEFEIWEMVE